MEKKLIIRNLQDMVDAADKIKVNTESMYANKEYVIMRAALVDKLAKEAEPYMKNFIVGRIEKEELVSKTFLDDGIKPYITLIDIYARVIDRLKIKLSNDRRRAREYYLNNIDWINELFKSLPENINEAIMKYIDENPNFNEYVRRALRKGFIKMNNGFHLCLNSDKIVESTLLEYMKCYNRSNKSETYSRKEIRRYIDVLDNIKLYNDTTVKIVGEKLTAPYGNKQPVYPPDEWEGATKYVPKSNSQNSENTGYVEPDEEELADAGIYRNNCDEITNDNLKKLLYVDTDDAIKQFEEMLDNGYDIYKVRIEKPDEYYKCLKIINAIENVNKTIMMFIKNNEGDTINDNIGIDLNCFYQMNTRYLKDLINHLTELK